MPRATRLLLLLLLLAPLGACGAMRGEPGPAREAARLRVENQSWLQMNIFVLTNGQQIRVGSVPPTSSARLQIPASVVGLGRELRFRADPVGSPRAATSFSLFVRPGEEVSLTIPPGVR